jgi:hypothetical protein
MDSKFDSNTHVPATEPSAADDAALRSDAVRVLSEGEALDWLRSQPGGQIKMSDTRLGEQWGWNKVKVGRWLDRWIERGLIEQRGGVTKALTDGVTNTVTNGSNEGVTEGAAQGVTSTVTQGVTEHSLVPVASRKVSIRNTPRNTPANRLVMRALSQPAESAAPLVTVTPGPVAATVTAEPSRVTIMPPEPVVSTRWMRGILILVAMGIGALALIINGQAGWRFGTTPLASITFTGLALGTDLLAIVLPGVAVALWHVRRPLLAGLAWTTWTLAATLATLASIGFVELHTSDTAAGRSALVSTATATADQRTARIAAAQLAVSVATRAREGECGKRGPFCRDREADERASLAVLQAAIAAPIPAAATVADADPQVTAAVRLASWVGLGLKPDDIVNARLALTALLPNLAGLVLAFAAGLAAPRRRHQ